MNLHFVLPFASKTGGVLVVLEYARRLAEFGHDVRIFHPLLPYPGFLHEVPAWKRPLVWLRQLAGNLLRLPRAFAWHDAPVNATCIPWIANRFLPDADVVFATAWPTAYSVAALSPSKGRKAYFIQHHEIWSGARAAVDGSYRLPLAQVTIAPWLTALMRESFGREVFAEVHNGIDLETFRPPAQPRDPARPPAILMLHHEASIKGVPDGLAVLERIHAVHPEVRIRLFGMGSFADRPSWIEHVRNPSRPELVRLYQESDIFLSPSLAEGWHLPPMEAMACGCAVVATRVGCIPVLEHGANLLSAEPGDRETLFRHVDALVRDGGLRAATARKGLETISAYGWEAKARAFERVVFRLASPDSAA